MMLQMLSRECGTNISLFAHETDPTHRVATRSFCPSNQLPALRTRKRMNQFASSTMRFVHIAQIAIGTLHLVSQNFSGAPKVRIPLWRIRLFVQRRFDRPIGGPAVVLRHSHCLLAVYR